MTPTLCAAALCPLTAWVQVLLAAAVATHMEEIPVATAFLGMTARSLSLLEQQPLPLSPSDEFPLSLPFFSSFLHAITFFLSASLPLYCLTIAPSSFRLSRANRS